MQNSVVNYLNLDLGTRLDAEYYKPEFISNDALLKGVPYKPLGEVSKSIKSFGAYALCNEMVLVEKGIPFFRCKDIKEGFVDFSDLLYIDDSTHKLLSKSAVNPNTVLLTMSGTVGNCAVADPAWNYPINSNQDIAKIETNDLVNPQYLSSFLNSKYGKTQTARLPVGSIQQHIFLWQLKGLLIYLPSIQFQEIIANLYNKAVMFLTSHKKCYSDAEKILLTDLNLSEWRTSHYLSFIKNYSDTQTVARIDAEYFQPIYEEVVNAIKAQGNYVRLGDVVNIKKCVEPGSDTYQDRGVKFLRVSNLSKFGIKDENQKYVNHELYKSLMQHQPKQGEILLSKDATPGIAYYLKDTPETMIPSGGILRVKIKNQEILYPEYLTLVINSIIVQKQIERDAGGSIINHWLVDQVKNILVPILSIAKQKEIAKLVDVSFCHRNNSTTLLEIAKCGVEMAIEQDEVIAQKWIEDQLHNQKELS